MCKSPLFLLVFFCSSFPHRGQHQPPTVSAKKSEYKYKNIFSAPSSRPLIGGSDTTLESQEHGAISELSGGPIRGLENFHFLYGDTTCRERVILKVFYADFTLRSKYRHLLFFSKINRKMNDILVYFMFKY